MEYVGITTNGRPARRVVRNGKAWLVAPITGIVPGVLPGSRGPLFYPSRECKRSAPSWNGIPITRYHPMATNGQHVSVNSPGIMSKQGIGYLKDTKWRGKLVHEGWFDEQKTRAVDMRVYNALITGEPMEVSTGLFTDNVPAPGTHNGRSYQFVARNYKPDHMAVLPDQIGACSVRDGCGLNVNRLTENEGRWATLASGVHVFIDSGVITKGPSHLAGKTYAQLKKIDKVDKWHRGEHPGTSSAPKLPQKSAPKAAPQAPQKSQPTAAAKPSTTSSSPTAGGAKVSAFVKAVQSSVPGMDHVRVVGPRPGRTVTMKNGKTYKEPADPRTEIMLSTHASGSGVPTTIPGDSKATGVGFHVDHDEKYIHISEMTSKIKGAGTKMVDAIVKHFPGYKIGLSDWSSSGSKTGESFWDRMSDRHKGVFTHNVRGPKENGCGDGG